MPKAKNEPSKSNPGKTEPERTQSTSTQPGSIRSRGFCFLMYENQLSTNLAVDNLNGALVLGRTLRVDHCKNYKQLERTSEGKMTERDADLGERLNALPELHTITESGGESDGSDVIDPEDPMASYLLEKRKKRRRKEAKKGESSKYTSDEKRDRKHKKHKDEDDDDPHRRQQRDKKRSKKLIREADRLNLPDDRDRKRHVGRTRDDDGGNDRRRAQYSMSPPTSSRNRHDRDYRHDDTRSGRRSPEHGGHDRYNRDASPQRSKPSYRRGDDLRR